MDDALQVAARAEACLRDGATDEARRILADFLVAQGVGAIVPPERISANAGLAWIYMQLASREPGGEYEQKAIGFGQAALLLEPQDALSFTLLPEDRIHLIAHNLMRHRKPAAARTLLQRLRDLSGSDDAAQLLELLDYVESESRRIDAMPPRGRDGTGPLLINVIVWGAPYVEMLFAYALPSLLASGNLPLVCRDREIIFDFYTTEGDRVAIEADPLTAAVKRFAKFRYNIIPDRLLTADIDASARWCAAAGQQCSAYRAQRIGADLMFLCGSGVYSARALSRAYEFFEEGYKVVACAMPRTLEARPHEMLAGYADSKRSFRPWNGSRQAHLPR